MILGLLLSVALAAPPDAGLSVGVVGPVTCNGAPIVPYMKLRVGDTVQVPAGASVELVLFGSGTRESWKGPARFVVGADASKAVGAAQVTSKPGSPEIGERLRDVPELVAAASRDRAGQHVVRGTAPEAPELSPEEVAELAAARETWAAMRRVAEPTDVLADVYLATVLLGLGRREEAARLLSDAQARCGACVLPGW